LTCLGTHHVLIVDRLQCPKLARAAAGQLAKGRELRPEY
jgi:hypothetical protein